MVELIATPNSGYRFSHWSGNASGTEPSTTVTMDSNKDVTANFVRQYTLTIRVSPVGSGTTTPTTGTYTYDAGTVVNLSATPGTGYRFSQWSGDASGTEPATTVTTDSDKDVTANFVRQYTLTMHISPPGSGTTTPDEGTHTYDEGTVVNLTATPNSGYRFSHWSGNANGTEPSTTVTMDSNKDVTANFVRQYTLTMHVSPAGGGTTTPAEGSHAYDAGTVVNLSATPNSGYRFSHWSSDITSTSPSVSITMDSDKDVTANFVRQYTLTIHVSPAGSGTTIPAAGTHIYDAETIVELIATPNSGYRFSHWSGDASSTEPATTVTMDSDKDVTANFVRQYTLNVQIIPSGSGTTSPAEGTQAFDVGTVVELSATPNPGYRFSHWGGDAGGTNPTTNITMDSDKDVIAYFLHQYTLTIHINPPGSGTTEPSENTHTYDAGEKVNLTAIPNPGYRFSHWSGNASGTEPSIEIYMNLDKDVTANFVRQYTLTMHVSPPGSGITVPSEGIHTYDEEAVVELCATPSPGYRFSHWSGDAGSEGECINITITSDKDVTANFTIQYSLTMHINPSESGQTTPGEGIHYYDPGTVVELSAIPNFGWGFSQWSGDASGTDPLTSITLDSNKDVTANFILELEVMQAETSLGQKRNIDGIAVIPLTIVKIIDPASQETISGIPVGSYEATVSYASPGIEILDVLPGDPPFDAPVFGIYNETGTTSLTQFTIYGIKPPVTVARLVARIAGCCLDTYDLGVTFGLIVTPDGLTISEIPLQPCTFQRGDTLCDATINIIDAMFGAQYIVGFRPIDDIVLLNLASVKHDSDGDIPNITDCMFIAQYKVGMRDECFNLVPRIDR